MANRTRLNPQSPIPLYQQLADHLRQDIERQKYRVDEKIPSEHELAQRFEIGRPTVRQATDLLVRRGLLERKRGAGTFVREPGTHVDLFSLTGTSAAFGRSDLQADIQLQRQPRLIKAGSVDALTSKGHAPDSNWLEVCRVASVADEPVLHEMIWLDADLFAAIEHQNVHNESLAAIVRDSYFMEPISADQQFTIVNATRHIASLLGVKQQIPLLQVNRSLHFELKQHAIVSDILCRTDRFEFSQTLYPAQASVI